MTKTKAGPGSLAIILFALLAAGAPSRRDLPATEYLRDLRFLASDRLKGRGNDEPEIDQAAAYIAERFSRCGLLPAGDNGTYYQHFDARTSVEVGPSNALSISNDGRLSSLTIGSDYIPLYAGLPGPINGELAFAGFGITAPELSYDDYAGIEVRGKVVAVLQHEPEEYLPASRFAGIAPSPYSTITAKAQIARAHGASALLVLTDPRCRKDRGWKRDVLVEPIGIPVVKLSESWSQRLLSVRPLRLAGVAAEKEIGHSPPLYEGATVNLQVDAIEKRRILKNVVGLIPGSRREFVVVGAHYDHIGLGERKSLSPEKVPEVHNGADDNASGTAGLMQLAAQLSRQKHDRGIVLVAFAGEEIGLLGSTEYTRHPAVPLSDSRAMINLDMIGRSTGEVLIGGVGTALEFRPLLDQFKRHSPLVFNYAETPQAASDHLTFSGEKIPVLFFFTGLHDDYHRPSDDWKKIDVKRSEEILRVVRGLVTQLTSDSTSLHFVDLDPDPALLGGSLGTAIWGLLPEFAWEGDGVLVSRVKSESSAQFAGLADGDIIIGCDGVAVFNRLDLVELLSKRGESDASHRIAVLRGDETRELTLPNPKGSGPTAR